MSFCVFMKLALDLCARNLCAYLSEYQYPNVGKRDRKHTFAWELKTLWDLFLEVSFF